MNATTDTSRYTSARPDAWHLLGTSVDDCYTANDAMKAGLLTDWDVRKVQLLAQDSGLDLPVPDSYALVRSNPAKGGALNVLGTVGKTYKVRQNEELAGMLDALVEEMGATFHAAGEFDGGRRAFVTLRLPGPIKIGGQRVDYCVSVVPSHDANYSTTLVVTPVHLTTASLINPHVKSAPSQMKLNLLPGGDRRAAQQAANFAFDYLDTFHRHAALLTNMPLTQHGFESAVQRAYGAADTAPSATTTRTNNKLEHMARLFGAKPAGTTAWDGLVALAEWHDHYSPVRGADSTPGAEARLRARKSILDPGFKDGALRLMMGE